MVYRPDRDRALISRTGPYRAAASRWPRRKVIITTLSVMNRSFGRVTVPTDWEPTRAGHGPTLGAKRGRARGTDRIRPGIAATGPVKRQRDGGRPVGRRHLGTEIADSDHMPVPSIGWAVLFETARHADLTANSWVITGTPVTAARRDYARVLPNCDCGGGQPVRRTARRWSGRPS